MVGVHTSHCFVYDYTCRAGAMRQWMTVNCIHVEDVDCEYGAHPCKYGYTYAESVVWDCETNDTQTVHAMYAVTSPPIGNLSPSCETACLSLWILLS